MAAKDPRLTLTGYVMGGYLLSAQMALGRLENLVYALPDRRPVTRADWAELALLLARELRDMRLDLQNMEQVVVSNGAVVEHLDVTAELERLLQRARDKGSGGEL